MRDLISKRTRTEFREVLVGWTIREIAIEFGNEDFTPNDEYCPPELGARRIHVERLYRNIDFRNPGQVSRVLRVYDSIISRLRQFNPEKAEFLCACLRRDGCRESDIGFVLPPDAAQVAQIAPLSKIDAPQLSAQIIRIQSAVDHDPPLAIGTAKELVETTCKTILSELMQSVAGTPDVTALVKQTLSELKLLPDNIHEDAKGAEAIKKILRSLGALVQGMAETRNLYGTGHGSDGRASTLTPRHARLMVGAATTLATFLFETHEARKKANLTKKAV
ncbi:MAG: abortive infection family protein [Roseomonas sp.]|jgi:hypothetical protein|nr:abortive infection family protein [Roseomonas sp.]MCA3298757.1 abortive infection family protein [Roseomonas sp.]